VRLWDVATGQEQACLQGLRGEVRSLVWGPDGRRLASGESGGTVRLWDVATGQEQACLQGLRGEVRSVAWSPDGRRLAGGGDGGTVLWDAATGQEQARLQGHRGRVQSLAWSPDGRCLAGSGEEGIYIWDANAGRLLVALEAAHGAWLARTNGGFCFFQGEHKYFHLAARGPGQSSASWFLPLGGFREVLHRPEKVQAALAGDLSGDDLGAEFARLGWADGSPWDGQVHHLPAAAPPPPTPFAAVETAPPPPALPPDYSLFRPGPALTQTANPPGREAILTELLTLLHGRSPVILLGPRRAGKTTVLHALKLRLGDRCRIRHVSLEGTAIRTADDLARLLEPELENDPRPAHVLRKRLAHDSQPVLLLDEIVHLRGADPPVFAWLRAVGQGEAGVLLAGAPWDWVQVIERANQAPGSSFGNDVTPVELGQLSEADAKRFLAEGGPKDVPIKADRTAAWIVKRCGGWPFYLQVMGHAVVQAVQAGTRRALVDEAGVADLYERRLLLDRDAVFRSRWQSELPPAVRAVLLQLKDGRPPLYRELSRGERQAVRDSGLCSSAGDWLDDRPFYDWIWRNLADLQGEK
jgi:hypothetical protein